MGLEIIYFLGALILLIGLIYATLNWHYRDRRKEDHGANCPRPVRA